MARIVFWFLIVVGTIVYWYVAQLAGAVAYLILGDCYSAPDPARCETLSMWINLAAFGSAGIVYGLVLYLALRWYKRSRS